MKGKFPDSVYSSLATSAFVIALLGSLLNGLTIATFLKHKKYLTVPNIIIFSMMVSNFVLSSVAIPFNIHANIMKKWTFGVPGCKAYGFLNSFCGLASMSHLAGAAFQRYDTIDRTTRGKGFFNERRAVYFVIFLWLYSFVFSIGPLVNWSSYTLEGVATSCAVDWSSSDLTAVSYTVVLFIFCFFLPLAIIVFSYYRVYKVVQLMRINANHIWGNSSVAARNTLNIERKMVFLILVMIGAFLISWTPYAVVSLISATGNRHLIGPLVSSISAYIAKSSCIYNPIIYVFMLKTFRRKMIVMLSSASCREYIRKKQRRLFPTTVLPKASDKDSALKQPFGNTTPV